MILFCTCILYKSGSNALRRMERGHISSQKFKQFSPKSSHRKCKFSILQQQLSPFLGDRDVGDIVMLVTLL